MVGWDRNHIDVDDFMLSCRVQGKFIEQAFMSMLRSQIAAPSSLRVNYSASGRNRPAHDVLAAMGFEDTPEGMFLRENRPLDCEFIQCQWTAPLPEVAA
jgi:predicted enzyme involved in methoxymalonyl-ACP biosynthesis